MQEAVVLVLGTRVKATYRGTNPEGNNHKTTAGKAETSVPPRETHADGVKIGPRLQSAGAPPDPPKTTRLRGI